MALRRPIRTLPAVGLMLCTMLSATADAAKPRPAESRIELEKLGYPGISSRLLTEGGSLLTLHFAGDHHLLLTYATRGLITRLPNDRPGDEDRLVAAVLLELPSGKVIARTEWRLHDRSRYLWALGDGRFLLRIQDSLSTFNPVANFGAGRTFERTSFAPAAGHIDAVVVTPDHKLVTIESSQPVARRSEAKVKAAATARKLAARPHFAADAHGAPPPTPYIPPDEPESQPVVTSAELYRLFAISGVGSAESPIDARPMGQLVVGSLASLPLFVDGFLKDAGQSRNQWNIDFHAFTGKDYPLAPIDSSCEPSVYRVAPAQFVSVNCRGVTGNVTLAAYDFAQHEMWEETLPSSKGPAVYATAPDAGRFAISRIVPTAGTRSPGVPLDEPPDIVTSQEVRVYQTQSGDLLLKVECTPAFTSLENFDIAPDGLEVAVIRDGAIELHRLPPLTRHDKEDLAELAKVTPTGSNAAFDLRAFSGTREEEAPPASGSASSAAAPGLPPNAVIVHMGDVPQQHSAPTLLNPDEKPEFQDNTAPPNL